MSFRVSPSTTQRHLVPLLVTNCSCRGRSINTGSTSAISSRTMSSTCRTSSDCLMNTMILVNQRMMRSKPSSQRWMMTRMNFGHLVLVWNTIMSCPLTTMITPATRGFDSSGITPSASMLPACRAAGHRIHPYYSSSSSLSTGSRSTRRNTKMFLLFTKPTTNNATSSLRSTNTRNSTMANEDNERMDDCLNTLQGLIERVTNKKSSTITQKATSTSSFQTTFREMAIQFCQQYRSLPPMMTFHVQHQSTTDQKKFDNDSNQQPTQQSLSNSSLSLLKSRRDREHIINYLATECAIQSNFVSNAIHHYQQTLTTCNDSNNQDKNLLMNAETRLYTSMDRVRLACTPLYEQVFHSLLKSSAIESIQFLVSLRADLLMYMSSVVVQGKEQQQQQQQQTSTRDVSQYNNTTDLYLALRHLDTSLYELFSTWFSPGLLEIQRITYQNTAASVIEIIALNEAVHPVKNLDDLRQRFGPDRRVYGLFHTLLPLQPLAVVHVSLQPQEIPDSMQDIYNQTSSWLPLTVSSRFQTDTHIYTSASVPTVAAFYSISNLQSGLAGIGLGEYLIKKAIQSLRQELPTITTFATLSPIPGFVQWLQERALHDKNRSKFASDQTLVDPSQSQSLCHVLQCDPDEVFSTLIERLYREGPESTLVLLNKDPLQQDHQSSENNETQDRIESSETTDLVRTILVRLAARYLVYEKHRSQPLDNVARFHIGNGALLYRINWGADLSRKGWKNSFGMMVNYRYDLDQISSRQAQYETNQMVPVDAQVQALLSNMEPWH